MSKGEGIHVEVDGPLAVLTIDSPPLNLWTFALNDALCRAVHDLELVPPRGLLIRARGRAFTGGVDVQGLGGLDRAGGERVAREMLGLTRRVANLPFPTVLAAHARCLTWGFELGLSCDFLLAAEGAQFGLVEAIVGLSPAMGGTQRLALRVGPMRAKEFVMTGDLYDAETMHGWGVVTRVLPSDGFESAARDFAEALAHGPTRAHAVTKQIVDTACSHGEPAAAALTPGLIGGLFETTDFRNGVASFLRDGPGKSTHHGS